MEESKKGKKLHKSLRLYLSKKLKKVSAHLPAPRPAASGGGGSSSARGRWLLTTCKHTKTPSLLDSEASNDRAPADNSVAAGLADVDRFLFENFRSLYLRDPDGDGHFSSPETPPSQANRAQEASTETSSSSLQSSVPSWTSLKLQETSHGDGDDSVAVVTFSVDPYADFLRSMQSMLETHHAGEDQILDWDFLEELLFCYLQLNDKGVHKHILRAFTDLTAGCRQGVPRSQRTAQSGRMRGSSTPPPAAVLLRNNPAISYRGQGTEQMRNT